MQLLRQTIPKEEKMAKPSPARGRFRRAGAAQPRMGARQLAGPPVARAAPLLRGSAVGQLDHNGSRVVPPVAMSVMVPAGPVSASQSSSRPRRGDHASSSEAAHRPTHIAQLSGRWIGQQLDVVQLARQLVIGASSASSAQRPNDVQSLSPHDSIVSLIAGLAASGLLRAKAIFRGALRG